MKQEETHRCKRQTDGCQVKGGGKIGEKGEVDQEVQTTS